MVFAGAELPDIFVTCALNDPQFLWFVCGLEKLLAFFKRCQRIDLAGNDQQRNTDFLNAIDRSKVINSGADPIPQLRCQKRRSDPCAVEEPFVQSIVDRPLQRRVDEFQNESIDWRHIFGQQKRGAAH